MGNDMTKSMKIIVRRCKLTGIDPSEKTITNIRTMMEVYRDLCKERVEYSALSSTVTIAEAGPYLFRGLMERKPMSRDQIESLESRFINDGWLGDVAEVVLKEMPEQYSDGDAYAMILRSAYIDEKTQSDNEIMVNMNLAKTKYYARKKEAILAFGQILWTHILRNWKNAPAALRNIEKECGREGELTLGMEILPIENMTFSGDRELFPELESELRRELNTELPIFNKHATTKYRFPVQAMEEFLTEMGLDSKNMKLVTLPRTFMKICKDTWFSAAKSYAKAKQLQLGEAVELIKSLDVASINEADPHYKDILWRIASCEWVKALLAEVIEPIAKFGVDGQLYYDILKLSYMDANDLSVDYILTKLNVAKTCYHKKKDEALRILSGIVWELVRENRTIHTSECDMEDVYGFFEKAFIL